MLTQIAFKLYQTIHILLSFSGCFFNLFLIYLTIYQTPKVIKIYSTLVLNFAITDFFACFIEFFVQQRFIAAGHTLGLISNGSCSYFGPVVCFTLYSLMLHFFAHTLWSLLLSFSYRYYILFHPTPLRRSVVFILLIIYIPSLFQGIILLFAYDDPDEIKSILIEYYPNYDLENKTITGTKNTFSFAAVFPTLHMVLPITPVYITILILRRRIIRTLASKGNAMAAHTKTMHSQLLKALTYQAALPCFYWFAVGSYALGQLNIIHHPVIESFAVCVILIPVFSPVSSFIFVKPYRDFILKLSGKRKRVYNLPRPSIPASSSNNLWAS